MLISILLTDATALFQENNVMKQICARNLYAAASGALGGCHKGGTFMPEKNGAP